MMTQGEFMDVIKLRDAGWTIEEIATEVGYHQGTVRRWLKAGGPPASRWMDAGVRVIDPGWEARIPECPKDGVSACWPEMLTRCCGLAERNRQ